MVEVLLYDCAGRLRATLLDEELPGGCSVRNWQRSGIPGGLYLVRASADGEPFSVRKVTLL
jgi:hypothetical protein